MGKNINITIAPKMEGKPMPLEDQVCTVEQGKRLYQLGERMEPQFYWAPDPEDENGGFCLLATFLMSEEYRVGEEWSPAYTAAELGLLLPDDCHVQKMPDDSWEWTWDAEEEAWFDFPTEAQAKADMLIHINMKELHS